MLDLSMSLLVTVLACRSVPEALDLNRVSAPPPRELFGAARFPHSPILSITPVWPGLDHSPPSTSVTN